MNCLWWPPEQDWKGCHHPGDSMAVAQVNREWLVSPSIPSHMRTVAKRTYCRKDNCPGVQRMSPVRMPKQGPKLWVASGNFKYYMPTLLPVTGKISNLSKVKNRLLGNYKNRTLATWYLASMLSAVLCDQPHKLQIFHLKKETSVSFRIPADLRLAPGAKKLPNSALMTGSLDLAPWGWNSTWKRLQQGLL